MAAAPLFSFKYKGELLGNTAPVFVQVPLNNESLYVGDAVCIASTGNTDGYASVAVAAKSLLGIIDSFVLPNGQPLNASNLPASCSILPSGETSAAVLGVTVNADGQIHALVNVSPFSVYAVTAATAPTAGTQYLGAGVDVSTATAGLQTVEAASAGTYVGKQFMVVPFGTTTGIDPDDSTRLRVIIHSSELFGVHDDT